MLFVVCGFFFFQINFLKKKSSRNTIRVSDNLDSDQVLHFVGPDLDPNCLQRLSADNKSPTRGERVKVDCCLVHFHQV